MSTSRTDTTPPELTDTGVLKLTRAYDKGTQRIVAHFENVIRPATESARDYLAEGVR